MPLPTIPPPQGVVPMVGVESSLDGDWDGVAVGGLMGGVGGRVGAGVGGVGGGGFVGVVGPAGVIDISAQFQNCSGTPFPSGGS